MKFAKLTALAAAIVMSASVASAATFGFSEGTRPAVKGTTDLGDVSPDPSFGYDVGTIGAGDAIEIYGRIVGSIDTFAFGFTSTGDFDVSFIFGGYTLENDTFIAESGFVSETDQEKTAVFRLLEDIGGGLFTLIDSVEVTTDRTAGDPYLFSGGVGDYVFVVDGTGDRDGRPVGLYDVKIEAVPLPASALLLMAGIGGLGLARRGKR